MVVVPTVPASGHLRAILINNGSSKTSSAFVDLILSAENATEMNLSTDSIFSPLDWVPYRTSMQYELSDDVVGPSYGEGLKSIHIKFRSVDLIESDVFVATITLDSRPPVVGTYPILINSAAFVTSDRNVTLTFDATDAVNMELLNEDQLNTFRGTIVPYVSELPWQLSQGNGNKSVYVRFFDDINNITTFYSANILLIGQSLDNIAISAATGIQYVNEKFITIQGTSDFDGIIKLDIKKE